MSLNLRARLRPVRDRARHIVRGIKYGPSCDYVSPNLISVPTRVPAAFSLQAKSFNPFVPHLQRFDRRFPTVGGVTLDEATLLYNYALRLKGLEFLEIGAWIGWSTATLATAGVKLTSIDPVFEGAPQGAVCSSALARLGLGARLIGGYSPDEVLCLAAKGRRWVGFFIDGDHDGEAPLRDVQACASASEPSSVVIMHDMIYKDVSRGLEWLRDNGWNCGIYFTSQVIGVAIRGSADFLPHVADPRVPWRNLIDRRWAHLKSFSHLSREA